MTGHVTPVESGPSAFAKLDIKHQGFLKSEDVSQLQGFNFKSADKNNDGKLDATEFNAAWTIYSGTPKS
jgi:Ca2+-binding EF-hand superfamily protein